MTDNIHDAEEAAAKRDLRWLALTIALFVGGIIGIFCFDLHPLWLLLVLLPPSAQFRTDRSE